MKRSHAALLPLMLALSACSTVAAREAPAAASAAACEAEAASIDSPPGRDWMREQGWRFATEEQAQAAYAKLVADQSPWPDWYTPYEAVLPAGTRFQMAVGGDSSAARPGGFGTFDRIGDVREVRAGLAVKQAWKPEVTGVVTFEVTRPLPVKIGPVGPQVDGLACRLLLGRWSQFQMLVPPAERLSYIRAVEERPLR
jgi:hypothetical protein